MSYQLQVVIAGKTYQAADASDLLAQLAHEIERLTRERDALLPVGARVVITNCKVCREEWPHPSVLSTSPVCERCRRMVERDVARLRETLPTCVCGHSFGEHYLPAYQGTAGGGCASCDHGKCSDPKTALFARVEAEERRLRARLADVTSEDFRLLLWQRFREPFGDSQGEGLADAVISLLRERSAA